MFFNLAPRYPWVPRIWLNFFLILHQNRKGLIGNDSHKHQQLLCIDATDRETAGYTFLWSFPWWIESALLHIKMALSASLRTLYVQFWFEWLRLVLRDRKTPKAVSPCPAGIPLLGRQQFSPTTLQAAGHGYDSAKGHNWQLTAQRTEVLKRIPSSVS